MPASILFADHHLSQRLERAEGMANASYIESRARLAPDSGAAWVEVAGTYAMFDTPHSQVTQTFGLGMFGEVTAEDLDEIESFFTARGAPVNHEISPLADPSVWPLISERRYAPFEFTNILYTDLQHHPIPSPELTNGIIVRIATAAESERWARTAAAGWSGSLEAADTMSSMMHTVFDAHGVSAFVAEQDGRPIATGALNIQNGVALLAGASTIPGARRQGAQKSLLTARLRYASEAGCEIATMGALPGSASQRNAERSGFRIACTRTKWRLPV